MISQVKTETLSQPRLKILISECPHDLTLSVLSFEYDIRQVHPVKRICLHHRVDRHILKYKSLAALQRMIKHIVADHISGKAGRSGETINMLLPVRAFTVPVFPASAASLSSRQSTVSAASGSHAPLSGGR